MKRFKFLSLIILVSIFSINCSKEGPAGPNGPAGPAGPQGVAGPIGTANVIFSPWFTSVTAWTNPGLSSSDYSFDRVAPGVTQAIIDNGVVLSYAKLSNDGSVVRTLPSTAFNSNGFHFFNYLIPAAGSIRYTYVYTDQPDIPTITSQFRYVIIPGGIAGGRIANGSAQSLSLAQLKAMSYDEILKLFNIPADGQGGY